MPQPHLPAPLLPRPEPGAQLLEAVRQRQSRPTLQLTQQWVHRRGVLDLERFCGTELKSALGPEALTWLRDLLALETPLHPAHASTSPLGSGAAVEVPTGASTAVSTGLPAGQADPEDPAETSGGTATAWRSDATDSPASEPLLLEAPPVEHQPLLEKELHVRAVAAVDEAFAALAQSFEQTQDPSVSRPAPMGLPADAALVPTPSQAPAPFPAHSGLWPSLRASAASLSSSLRPLSDATLSSPLPAPQIGSSPSPQEEGLISGASHHLAVPAPEPPLQESLTVPAAATPLPEAPELPGQSDAQPDEATEAVSDASETAPEMRNGAKAPIGLLRRLRTVMRDCVDETVALLRTPEQQRHDDRGGFVVSEAREPALPNAEPDPFSWTSESFPSPSSAPAASMEAAPTPSPMDVPDGEDIGSSPSLPSLVSRLRFSLPNSRPRVDADQPAPPPAGLSDLQAWLPDRGDLPRAS